MSTATLGATALARPLRRPDTDAPARALAPAPDLAPRRVVRPRVVHAVVTLVGIGVILLVQLLLSIGVADGAYRIAELQSEQKDLTREQQARSETLDTLSSPQFLSTNAEGLGMVASGSLPYLDLDSGEMTGSRTGNDGSLLGKDGKPIGNVLLDGVAALDPKAVAAQQAAAGSAISGRAAPGIAAGAPADATVGTEDPSTSAIGTGAGASSVSAAGDAVASDDGMLPSPTIAR